MTKEKQQFNKLDLCLLTLLRIGLQFETAEHCSVHFSAFEQLIEQVRIQTVLPMIYDAIMQLPDDQKPSKTVISLLKSETICSIIFNERLLVMQDELLTLLKTEDIPCVILKGTSAAVYYPKPELRVQGDIDILVDKADLDHTVMALERAGFQNNSIEHGFHKTFSKNDAHIELHHAFSTVPPNKAGEYIIELMQTAVKNAYYTNFENHTFPILSDIHQAVSLLLHMQKHITTSGLGLRQLCDWAMFITKVNTKYWQENIRIALDNCGLLRFAEILTKTCVLYLGLPPQTCPWCLHIPDDICFDLMSDFLKSGNFGQKDTVRGVSSNLIPNYAEDAKHMPTLLALMKNLNRNAIHHFPVLKKMPAILPIMWIVLPIRYIIRMAFGKRPKHSLKKILSSANQRDLLYSKFHLFETSTKLHSQQIQE